MKTNLEFVEKPVLFSEERLGARGLGVVSLANTRSLNALTLPMFESLASRLVEWSHQDDIAAIVLRSESPKAFSAGGDVKSIGLATRQSSESSGQSSAADALEFARRFFTNEYFVDALIRYYPKPVICFAHGITMGGGLGLINGASARFVTEKTMMAMPEITIGFFPDVCATYFLNQLPDKLGLFMGLTGARISGKDAVAFGLADALVAESGERQLFADLLKLNWSGHAEEDHRLLSQFIKAQDQSRNADIDSPLFRNRDVINQLLNSGELVEVDTALRESDSNDPWIRDSISTYQAGSPTSKAIAFYQLNGGISLEPKQAYLREWDMALNLCKGHDFYEGVRALLIDKDKSPKWDALELEGAQVSVKKYFKPSEPNLLAAKFEELPKT